MSRLFIGLLLAALGCAHSSVLLVDDDGEQTLEPELAAQVRAGLEAHLRSCPYNSVDDADWIDQPPEVLEASWAAAVAGRRFEVRYPSEQRIETLGGPVPVKTIVLELAANFPGWFGTRSDAGVVGYEHCNGAQLMEFICAPGVRERTPPAYGLHCAQLDQWRSDQAAPAPP